MRKFREHLTQFVNAMSQRTGQELCNSRAELLTDRRWSDFSVNTILASDCGGNDVSDIETPHGTGPTGRSPRIPFKAHQVMILEEKFQTTRYLNGSEVTYLAHLLNLTENRVKIWFQNRRARQRRMASSTTELFDRRPAADATTKPNLQETEQT